MFPLLITFQEFDLEHVDVFLLITLDSKNIYFLWWKNIYFLFLYRTLDSKYHYFLWFSLLIPHSWLKELLLLVMSSSYTLLLTQTIVTFSNVLFLYFTLDSNNGYFLWCFLLIPHYWLKESLLPLMSSSYTSLLTERIITSSNVLLCWTLD